MSRNALTGVTPCLWRNKRATQTRIHVTERALVRTCGFTETLRRAAQREGVGMTTCHGLGEYIGACCRCAFPDGGLSEPTRVLPYGTHAKRTDSKFIFLWKSSQF